MLTETLIIANIEATDPYGGLALPAPIVAQHEWIYAHPLKAILQIVGSDIHAVVSSRKIAAEVRILWKLAKFANRLRARREEDEQLELLDWYRQQGCPV